MHQSVQRAALHNSFVLSRGRLAGLGVPGAPSTTQMVQQVGSIASAATVGALSATVGSSGFILGISGAIAIPIIGAAIAGVTLGIVAILNSGCGQTCIVTSNWANQAETLLLQNAQAYFALPAPRSAEAKAQALANFDQIWTYLSQQCGNPALGSAGQRCISDRMAGACTWHQTHPPQFPGEPDVGQCWNWFSGYRDPIANDPAVVTQTTVDPQTTIGQVAGNTVTNPTGTGLDIGTLALIGVGALMLFAAMGSN